MITTKTIAEGDTRASALQPILAAGGTLRAAVRNLPWPGAAVVAVSVLQLTKGPDDGPKRLDGEPVAQINSRLRPKAERPDPVRLRENAGRCYLGSNALRRRVRRTFPFPDEAALDGPAAVARAGEQLHRARAALMLEGGFGLTESYNRLADPACEEAAVAGLRELHRELDRAVCEAYGWRGLEIPRFEEPTSDAERRALAAFDDEVIDRLFALNAERAGAERGEREKAEPKRQGPGRRGGSERGSGWLF